MRREMLVAVKAGRCARLEKLDRGADAPFRRGSNLFELTSQVSERERWREWQRQRDVSSSPEANWELHFQQSPNKRELMLYVNHV
jgi:hypothetical protein